jgi:putative heme degradation protein
MIWWSTVAKGVRAVCPISAGKTPGVSIRAGLRAFCTGCVQSFTGMAEILPSKGNLTLLHAGPSLMALELSAVTSCWLTTRCQGVEHSTMLELYDSYGAAIAVFDADETLCARQRKIWDRLAATL